jgi:hypothetical protein
MVNYLSFSKPIQFQEAHNGLIVLCEDGSIYRLFYKEKNNDVEDVVVTPIYMSQSAKDFQRMCSDPRAGQIQIIKPNGEVVK